MVSVKELDDGNEGTLYLPSTLRVRTCIQGNSISPRGNTVCQGFNGDCRNLVSTIEVLKLTPNSQLPLTVTITYNVGCACMTTANQPCQWSYTLKCQHFKFVYTIFILLIDFFM